MTEPGAPPPLRVTRLCEAHIPAVADIERLCFSQPWSERALRLLLIDGQGVGYVALEADGRAVGYAGMFLAPDEGQIASVAAHPAFRRRGAGRAVLRALIADAAARELERLVLEVRVSNRPARTLYLSEGFVEAGLRRGFYTHPREDAVVMLRRLREETGAGADGRERET